MLLRKLHLCGLAATLATSVLTTGCQPPPPPPAPANSGTVNPQPAPPAQSETVIYNKWETETHRPHKEMHQRPADEQKEYHDWRQNHPDIH